SQKGMRKFHIDTIHRLGRLLVTNRRAKALFFPPSSSPVVGPGLSNLEKLNTLIRII
ncbi:hypothetical protein AVEN_96988-2-1, partial [Araneus ventricosus]